jgi:hypothetical protein
LAVGHDIFECFSSRRENFVQGMLQSKYNRMALRYYVLNYVVLRKH